MLSPLEREERAADARALLANPLLKEILAELEDRSIQELRQADLGGLTAQAAHARIKALDEIKAHLKSIVSDEKMASRERKVRG